MLSERERIRIVLVDDHAVARAGIREMLEIAPDMEVVGEAEDGEQAQKLLAELHPHVVLLDLEMPGCCVFELIAWIQANLFETVALVVSGHQSGKCLARALQHGVRGYLSKADGYLALTNGIRRAICGEFVFNGVQLERAAHWKREVDDLWNALGERERQVLSLLAHGLSSMSIAEQLSIGVKAVEYHITNLYGKLHVQSRTQAVAWFWQYRPDSVLPGEDQ